MLNVGIVGLPNVGKSSLFNALTAAGAPAENYPFCTVEPNVGIVAIPDARLARIHELGGSREAVPATIRFVDIAGLVQGAAQGEGLGNRFLARIREVDAIALVLRCFQHPGVVHVMGSVDPLRDLGVVETELALADLEVVERRREKVVKAARSGEKDAIRELSVLERVHEALSGGRPVRELSFSEEERTLILPLGLLTQKPVLLVANVGEDEVARSASGALASLRGAMGGEGTERSVVAVSAAIEAELALLEPSERQAFLQDLGVEEGGLERVIRAAYGLLDLITFFTSNERQSRAWTVPRGTRAPGAAGVIHTDFQRGFIGAETIGYEDFVRFGSMRTAREGGAVRSEGKDYLVQDGDLILFRFHV